MPFCKKKSLQKEKCPPQPLNCWPTTIRFMPISFRQFNAIFIYQHRSNSSSMQAQANLNGRTLDRRGEPTTMLEFKWAFRNQSYKRVSNSRVADSESRSRCRPKPLPTSLCWHQYVGRCCHFSMPRKQLHRAGFLSAQCTDLPDLYFWNECASR